MGRVRCSCFRTVGRNFLFCILHFAFNPLSTTYSPQSEKEWIDTIYSAILRRKHKNTRLRVLKVRYLVKISKKSCQKLLTNPKGSDNICKHSTRETSERAKKEILKGKQKVFGKKLKKLSKKYWQEDIWCDILFELSRESGKQLDLEN